MNDEKTSKAGNGAAVVTPAGARAEAMKQMAFSKLMMARTQAAKAKRAASRPRPRLKPAD